MRPKITLLSPTWQMSTSARSTTTNAWSISAVTIRSVRTLAFGCTAAERDTRSMRPPGIVMVSEGPFWTNLNSNYCSDNTVCKLLLADDNECLLNTHNCQPPYECRNTMGSFRCERVRHSAARPTTTPATTSTTSSTTAAPVTTPSRPSPPSYDYYNRTVYYPTRPRPTPARQTYASQTPRYTFYPGSPYQNMPCDDGFERTSQGACAGA